MTSIKKLLDKINSYSNINIIDAISFDEINYDSSKYLINKFHNECYNSRFSNNDIFIYIKRCTNVTKISSNLCNINIYLYSNNNYNSIFKLIKIYRRLYILSKIYNITKEINFHIALCKLKRYFPKKNEIFESKHFNGGFTNILNNDIYIIRSCEYAKVMIHELLHHVNIINDTLLFMSYNEINKLKSFFRISNNTDFEPNEGNIEFWATIYNLLFISVEYNINFKLLYNKELAFSYIQYNKIIKKYNNNIWYEKTNIFAYFILKLILLKNYKKYLKIPLPYNQSEISNFFINNYNSIKKNNIKDRNNNLNAMLFSQY